ncbi:putative clathrin assembly protein [Raphanus sativus]|nr:putative clathrin assembly protein [Raphanus sativus]
MGRRKRSPSIHHHLKQSSSRLIKPNNQISLFPPLRPPCHHSRPFNSSGNRHLEALLSAGTGSRATASSAVEAVMDLLHTTGDACVALKSSIIVHHIVNHGRFILQDQLSVFPASGARNYLKLSGFRDGKSPLMWELSSWVRWYALYNYTLSICYQLQESWAFSLLQHRAQSTKTNKKAWFRLFTDFLREVDALVGLLQEAWIYPFCGGGKTLADKISVRPTSFTRDSTSLKSGPAL